MNIKEVSVEVIAVLTLAISLSNNWTPLTLIFSPPFPVVALCADNPCLRTQPLLTDTVPTSAVNIVELVTVFTTNVPTEAVAWPLVPFLCSNLLPTASPWAWSQVNVFSVPDPVTVAETAGPTINAYWSVSIFTLDAWIVIWLALGIDFIMWYESGLVPEPVNWTTRFLAPVNSFSVKLLRTTDGEPVNLVKSTVGVSPLAKPDPGFVTVILVTLLPLTTNVARAPVQSLRLEVSGIILTL